MVLPAALWCSLVLNEPMAYFGLQTFPTMRFQHLLVAGIIYNAGFAQVPSYVPTNGLQSWYPFNGNANDESGNGYNGTVIGAVLTADRAGTTNAAYSFNGTNSYISLSGNTSIVLDVSLSLWMKPFNTNDGYVLDRDICGNGNGWAIYWANNGQIYLRYGVTGNVDHFINASASVASWHHVVAIRDVTANELRLYLDGQLASTISFPTNPFPNTSLPILVGESNCNPAINPNFFGDIDDIGIWDRVLTLAEIEALYNGVGSPPCVSGITTSLAGLNTSYQTTDPASTLTGTPEGGVFFGPGVSGSTFNPATAGAGQHTIVYTYVDQDGCVNSTGLCTVVTVGMGVNDPDGMLGGVRVFPNPTDGTFTLELEIEGLVTLTVHDARGRQVLNQTFIAQGRRSTRVIDLSHEASGSYSLRLSTNGGSTRQQLVKR